jgi:hypothetical protein
MNQSLALEEMTVPKLLAIPYLVVSTLPLSVVKSQKSKKNLVIALLPNAMTAEATLVPIPQEDVTWNNNQILR